MNEQDRPDVANALMGQLFALNMGILFAAFFAIGMWTQGVPRKLCILAGFAVGLLVVLCFPLARFCAKNREASVRWLAYASAATLALALVLSWPTAWGMSADSQWVYFHRGQTVAAGLAWMVASVVLLTFFYWWSDRNLLQYSSVALGLMSLSAAGVICQLLASMLLIGGPWLWPSRSVNTLASWYPWLSQGVAVGLISASGLGMNALTWLNATWPPSICVLGCIVWLTGLSGAVMALGGTSAWAVTLGNVAGSLVVIWLVLVGRHEHAK